MPKERASLIYPTTGPFPSEIGDLTELRVLSAFSVNATLPPQLSQLDKLEWLNIETYHSDASLVQTIPQAWGDLPDIRYLRIKCSQCTGSIPVSFGRLQTLEHLIVDAGSLDGEIPAELVQLQNLKTLDLGNSRIRGNLEPLNSLASLEKFIIRSAYLSGPYPTFRAAAKMKHIEIEKTNGGMNRAWLDSIDYDYITIGPLPPEWGQLANLEFIETTMAQGPLPPEWGQLANLKLLFLGRDVEGRLPPEWSGMRSLERLWITDQNLEGTLPPEWSAMSNLTRMYLNENLLEGPLPSQWSALSKLRFIDLSYNFIDGSLPPSWGDWTSVQYLACSGCGLTGNIPSTWSRMTKLKDFLLSDNELSGAPPDWWGNMLDLTHLFLSGNNFEGPFPQSLARVPNFVDPEIGWAGWSIDAEGLTGCFPRKLLRHPPSLWTSEDWNSRSAFGRLKFCGW